MIKKTMLFMLAISCTLPITTSFAEQTNYAVGSLAGPELKLNLSTRFLATGSAGIALVDDKSSATLNPAGLAFIKGGEIGVMGNAYLEGTTLGNIPIALQLLPGAGIGANLMALSFGELDKFAIENDLPVLEGSFNPMVYVVSVGYGQQLMSTLAVGGAVKLYGLNIDTENYNAVAIDLGMQFHLSENLKLAATVQNLGTAVEESELSMLAKAGMAYKLPIQATAKDSWHVLLDVNLPFGDVNYTSANVGTEYWYNDLAALRVGYIIKDQSDLGGMNGLTAGLGGKLPLGNFVLGIDYAMLSYGELGLVNQFELSFGW